MAMNAQEIFMKLIVGVVLIYLLEMFGVIDKLLELMGVTYGLPSLMSIISLFIVGFGVMLLARVIMGPNRTLKGLTVELLLGAALVGLFIFLPEILPPELASVARMAQAVIGFG